MTLRLLSRFAIPGWEEKIFFSIERLISKSRARGRVELISCAFKASATDTLDESDSLYAKQALEDRIRQLKKDERLTLVCDLGHDGTVSFPSWRRSDSTVAPEDVTELKGLKDRLNPMYRGEITLTAAEFALYFEGADLEKRFIDSPIEIKKSFPTNRELQTAAM